MPLARLLSLSLLSFALVSPGCGSSSVPVGEEANEAAPLNELAEAYRVYQITKSKPPTKLADLNTVEMIGGNGVARVKKGEILVEWGATLPDTSEEPGKVAAAEVLAYGKDVPEKGGFVLLLDRTVAKMTPEEFKAAPKAGKK